MVKSFKRYSKYFFLLLALIIIVGFFALPALLHKPSSPSRPTFTGETPLINTLKDTFSYKGEDGKDALTLLKEHAMVGQDKSGLVTIISGRKADTSKREYWAFYVNGKLSPVGPAEYKTKKTDAIQWKIEKY